MAAGEEQAGTRRSVVPEAARRTPWFAAVWTGLGAAIVCATAAIVAVAIFWLPVSGTDGRTNSAIRAGLLTFLASVHGGITVDGVAAAWLPLGLVLIVGGTAWRAGSGLADATYATDADDEHRPMRLALVGLAQAATFTAACLVAVPFATLGTSRAPFFGVALGAFVTFVVTGGTAFVRSTALREWCAERTPAWLPTLLRGAGVAVTVYLAAGALLVAGSLVLHHSAAELLSQQVGGGLGGVPILLLGVLAAPNAVIAGASYLAGPGFAIGAGTNVSLFGTAHGTLPAFPILAAVPTGPGTSPVAWTMAALTPLLAGIAIARLCARAEGWRLRFASVGGAALIAGVAMLVLAWQGGGALGDDRLATVGASPWRVGGAVVAAIAVIGALGLGLAAARHAVQRRRAERDADDDEPLFAPRRTPRLVAIPVDDDANAADNAADDDSLAG